MPRRKRDRRKPVPPGQPKRPELVRSVDHWPDNLRPQFKAKLNRCERCRGRWVFTTDGSGRLFECCERCGTFKRVTPGETR